MLRGESAGSTRRNDMSRLLRYQLKAVSVRACDQEVGRVNRWRGVRVRRLDSCRAVRVSWAVIRNSAPVRLPFKWQLPLHLRLSGEAAIHGVWQLDRHTDATRNRSGPQLSGTLKKRIYVKSGDKSGHHVHTSYKYIVLCMYASTSLDSHFAFLSPQHRSPQVVIMTYKSVSSTIDCPAQRAQSGSPKGAGVS